MLNALQVGSQYNPDGISQNPPRGNREGATIVSGIHGKYYEAAFRGQLFIAQTVIAGVVIPVAAATLNSKFTLWNPASSGKIVELVSCTIGVDSATDVVNTVGLMIQRSLTATSGIPTTVTNITPQPLGLGGTAKATVATQATLTNVAIPGVQAAVTIPFYQMWSYGAVTSTAFGDTTHQFDGKILLAPDDLVALCTNVAASTASSVTVVWAEWQL